MAEELNNQTRPLKDFTIPQASAQPSCIVYPLNANNFEIKSGTIHLLPQYFGNLGDDPHMHLQDFLIVCETQHNGGLPANEFSLRLFPFSLKDKAKAWLFSLPPGSITTWADLATKFLRKFFPAQRTNKIRKEIVGIFQMDGEVYHEYWDRYMRLLNSCPHHNIEDWQLMQYFYEGLLDADRMMVDATSGGGLMNKNAVEAKQMFQDIADNSQQFNYRRPNKKSNVYEVGTSSVEGQITTLTNLVKQLLPHQQQVKVCSACSMPGYTSMECSSVHDQDYEQVNVVGSYQNQQRPRNDPFSNTYNLGWRNHPNFKWSTNQNFQQGTSQPYQAPTHPFQPPQPSPPRPTSSSLPQGKNLEDLVASLALTTQDNMQRTTRLEQSIKNIEHQMGQLAAAVNQREQGKLPVKSFQIQKESMNKFKLSC